MFVFKKILLNLSFLHCLSAITQHCHQATGRCFWISDAPAGSWSQGRTACQSEGGDLAVMETEELFNYVLGEFSLNPQPMISLNDGTQESDFRWVNGAPLYYNKWASNEPNGRASQNCVKLDSATRRFADIDCSAPHAFLCSTLAPNCAEVKDGCSDFPGAFIGMATGPHTAADFYTAQAHCEELGQKLLTIDSQEEEDSLSAVLTQDYIMLGLSDVDVETIFRRTDGVVSSWFNWASDEPDGYGGNTANVQDCVARRAGSGLWVDVDCDVNYVYYCEAPRMYLNNKEMTTTDLIDNNSTTCVQLPGENGCNEDQISVRSPWVDRILAVNVTIQNVTCDELTAIVKTSWSSPYERTDY